MTSPWLSVVSVVKDDPTGFERTLQSVMMQQLDGVEWLIVDSSQDRLVIPAALETFHGDAHYTWINPEGVYQAMNHALNMASGDFIYFANAGDTFASPRVLEQVRPLMGDQVWAFGQVEIVEANGLTVLTPQWDYMVEKERGFSRGLFPSHQGTFARSEVIRKLGGFDPSFRIAADYAMVLRLSQTADPLVLPIVVGRFYEGGISTRKWQESFREFHRARLEILRPSGLARIREMFDTLTHWSMVWIVKTIRPRLTGKSM